VGPPTKKAIHIGWLFYFEIASEISFVTIFAKGKNPAKTGYCGF
jgi:hypothetical protein